MFIDRIELNNFRLHRSKTVNFGKGLIAIIGENGAGKSSIVEGLDFALTGNTWAKKNSDVITKGTDIGYVRLLFSHDGKKGEISRWLDKTKVELTFDGQTYKKAGEVKNLWQSLLNISPEVISNVIIARQNQIPLLFSGDQTLKYSLFQKIFTVPNTEGMRNVIWNKYIKQAPEHEPVTDGEKLKARIVKCESEISSLEKKLAKFKDNDDKIAATKVRIDQLRKAIHDAPRVAELTSKLAQINEQLSVLKSELKGKSFDEKKLPKLIAACKDATAKLTLAKQVSALEVKIESVEEQLATLNITEDEDTLQTALNDCKQQLLDLKANKVTQAKIEALKSDNTAFADKSQLTAAEDNWRVANAAMVEVKEKVMHCAHQMEALTTQINALAEEGDGVCPTCEQNLPAEMREELRESCQSKLVQLTKSHADLKAGELLEAKKAADSAEKVLDNARRDIMKRENNDLRILELEAAIIALPDDDTEERLAATITKLTTVLADLRKRKEKQTELLAERQLLERQIAEAGDADDLQIEVDNLEKEIAAEQQWIDQFDQTTQLLEERTDLQQQKDNCTEREGDSADWQKELTELEEQLTKWQATKETMLLLQDSLDKEKDLLTEELLPEQEQNEKAIIRNRQITTYTNKLRLLYDFLHIQRFPKLLIEKYTYAVGELMEEYVSKFNLPFALSVDEQFNVRVCNLEGYELPDVSGGQGMVIGICLRYALHTLFGKAFPLLIVDEGTTHMSATNMNYYYASLKQFQKQSNVEQIIVVDPDPYKMLGSVCDTVIEIEEPLFI